MNTFTKPWFARFKNELWLLMETDSPIDSSILAICAARYFAAGMNSKQAALATADYFRLTYCRLHTSASDGSPLPSYFAHDPAPVILPAYPVILPANGAFALDLLQTLEDRAKDVNYYIEKLKQHLADTADTFEDNIKTTVNITLNKPITLADFLEWEPKQPIRYEFDGSHPVACPKLTTLDRDWPIRISLDNWLYESLRNTPYEYYGYNEKIATSGSIRRPDGIVARRAERDPHDFVTDPIIIFEVISSFTSATDRISKNREYESTPSIQHYVILELARAAATVFSRCNGEWTGWLLLQDELLSLPEIGLKIPLAELYDA